MQSLFSLSLSTVSKKRDINYVLNPSEWNSDMYNNSLNVLYHFKYRYTHGSGKLNAGLRSGLGIERLQLSPIKTRIDQLYQPVEVPITNQGRLGNMERGINQAPESALFFAGGNPEELMENKYTRSVGFFPAEWGGYGNTTNHFHHGGGMNIRGLWRVIL